MKEVVSPEKGRLDVSFFRTIYFLIIATMPIVIIIASAY